MKRTWMLLPVRPPKCISPQTIIMLLHSLDAILGLLIAIR